ncbi:exodeoxyribonuclease V subunit alpha [Methylohalobius crimeensis]|uniref:exodeoxyribonuclease V subunit alpha n=1 Tax=Methylohalobius crimeensis TaxID=244365 RepID=UPI0003B3B309|nr:exodeoxyribonuclease V subunit alpha [Methylohalobius crimeensis]
MTDSDARRSRPASFGRTESRGDRPVAPTDERHPHARVLADFFARKAGAAGRSPRQYADRLERLLSDLLTAQDNGHVCLTLGETRRAWLEKLTGLHQPAGEAPLVLEENRLYFQRLWQYEERLVAGLHRLTDENTGVGSGTLHECAGMRDLTPMLRDLSRAAGLDDSQMDAVRRAAANRFFIITGGPGTGKTTTVIQLLALLLWVGATGRSPLPKVALAAPTGKAAQRLQETIGERIGALPVPESVKQAIPDEATTLHRLLGARPDTVSLRHDAQRPLPYDVVVVDEASMVDLALMSKLVQALPSDARLYLLGDRDQLASVEAGSVLADLCDGLPGHTHRLVRTHRFAGELQDLAAALQQGDAAGVMARLRRGRLWLKHLQDFWGAVDEGYAAYWKAVQDGAEPAALMDAFGGFQVLCAHRRGPLGSEWLNDQLERRWRQKGWIPSRNASSQGGRYYPGRPVLIGENVPELGLFNGDIGICLAGGRVWFGDGRQLAAARLPRHETVYAQTCHKSQGSEFGRVLVVLPPKSSEVLTRELVYTAVTRAKETILLWGSEEVLEQAVTRGIRRSGGLRRKL